MNINTSPDASNLTDCQEIQVPYVLFFIIGIVSLAENIAVVVAILCTPKLHTPMYLFICNLSSFNIISSLVNTLERFLIMASSQIDSYTEHHLDDVIDTLFCVSTLGYFCCFLVIGIDRYLTIFHALRYHAIVTCSRATMVLGLIWVICGAAGALIIKYNQYIPSVLTFGACFVIALLVILPIYLQMFLLARKHAGHIVSSLPRSVTAARKTHLPSLKSMQAALTLTILFGVFMVCWAPLCLHMWLIFICPGDPYCECYRSLFKLHLLFSVSHGIIDPVIYAFRSTELKQSLWSLLSMALHLTPVNKITGIKNG